MTVRPVVAVAAGATFLPSLNADVDTLVSLQNVRDETRIFSECDRKTPE
jgi:hypothetical protein